MTYQPFGDEWKRHIMKYMPKAVIVGMLRDAYMRNQIADEMLELLKELQQLNMAADGEDAGLWNINGEIEEKIDGFISRLTQGAKSV